MSEDGKCDLQKVAQDVGMHLDIRYDKQLRHQKEDWSSPAIMRNPQKCILCGRCMEVCNEIQGINVLSKENRGFHTLIAPAYGEKLADTNCINCGQCVQVCPTGALTVHYHTYGLYRQKELGKKLIIQVAPSVRITLAEALGEQPGVVSTGRLVSALKRLGFLQGIRFRFLCRSDDHGGRNRAFEPPAERRNPADDHLLLSGVGQIL